MNENQNEPIDPNLEENVDEKSFFGIIVHSFFIIPFLIAVFCLLLFASVKLLTSEQQSAYDLLEDVKTGGLTKRWQAAFELSKILANSGLVPVDERFDNELISAFAQSSHDDNRVRQYLALAMGRTQRNVFFEPLSQNITEEKEENLPAVIYSLGMLQDKRAIDILQTYLDHPVARIRSIAVVAMGNLNDVRSVLYLKKALHDPEPNVQWGAAISLATLGDDSGAMIVYKLLDREYLAQFPEVDDQEKTQLLLNAIEATQNLQVSEIKLKLKELAESDQNMKVRAAALKYTNL